MINASIRLTLLSCLVVSVPGSFVYGKGTDKSNKKADCCSKVHEGLIHQKNIPLIITESGKYKLVEDITYNGSGSAITIHADNVQLSLGSFSITLSDNSATGISVNNVSEFVIDNDSIKNTSAATQVGFGIVVSNSQKGSIKNIFTLHHSIGLLIENSTDISIEDSEFFNAIDAGASVNTSTNVIFDNCVFAGGNNGLILSGANQDCGVIKSKFPRATFANLLVQQMNGMLIEHCSFTNIEGDPAKLALVQLGDADPADVCNDVIIRDCTIVNRPAHFPVLGNTAPEGLGIYQGSGFLVESCVIDIDNTNQDPDADLSGVHISNPDLGINGTVASNVIIRNCVVQGPATDGFYPDVGASGVVIEYCLATGAQKNGILCGGTSASVIQNNTVVGNGTNGIFLGETSISNSVNNNVVNSNGSNGIRIGSSSSKNTVEHNEVFNNGVNGIDDQGNDNHIYGNVAYGNAHKNYNTATDIIVVSSPGDPTKSAENISA